MRNAALAALLPLSVLLQCAASSAPTCEGLFLACERQGVRAHWGIYRLADDKGALKEVIPGGRFPVWSPDGKDLALVCNGAVCLWNEDIGVRPRFAMDVCVRGPGDMAWGPDGGVLVLTEMLYELGAPRRTGLVVVGRDDFAATLGAPREPRRIISMPASLGSPSWAPDGTISAEAYSCLAGVGTVLSHVGIVGPSGEFKRLTAAPDRSVEQRPLFSPDGSRIAYDVVDIGSGTRRVQVLSVAEGIATDPFEGNAFAKAFGGFAALGWSPDGSHLAVACFPEQRGLAHGVPEAIFVTGPQGEARPFFCDGQLLDADWSPDGTCLALLTAQPAAPGASPACTVRLALLDVSSWAKTGIAEWGPEVPYDIHSDPILPVEIAWRPAPKTPAPVSDP
jgi:hypothetical protein